MKREFNLSHGIDGWQISVQDVPWVQYLTDEAASKFLVALGHPCCGKGPLSKVHISWRTLQKLGWPVPEWIAEDDDFMAEDAMEHLWFRIMNVANLVPLSWTGGKRWHLIASVPVSREVAEKINPQFVEDYSFLDDEECDDEDSENNVPG